MPKYCYFPILKTRPSEVNAYDALDVSIKDEILPIIEMTGELGYTYSSKCKDTNLHGKRRPGDINKKIQKILDFIEERKFILDITDDDSLKYDGLSNRDGGLLNPSNGYKNWRDFLQQNADFKNQVIPTIQFDTNYPSELDKQIEELDKAFEYLALKLPPSNLVSEIVDYIYAKIGNKAKLFLIIDYSYVPTFDKIVIQNGLANIDTKKVKALIPVSSSFPTSVVNVSQPIYMNENNVSDCVKNALKADNIFHGDYSSIHPTRYEMGGAGWYARIDYIVRDQHTKRPIAYNYCRGQERNKSSEFYTLAAQVVSAKDYSPIFEINTVGDQRIAAKANGEAEGKAPAYWITVRSNLYMTMQYLYQKQQSASSLVL